MSDFLEHDRKNRQECEGIALHSNKTNAGRILSLTVESETRIRHTMPPLMILSAGDYEPLLRVVSSSLQGIEFQVFEVADGMEAVRKAQEIQPDLVLLDIGLPKLGGIEAAKRIRELAPQSRLLFVSQESNSEMVGETFRVGAQGYVHMESLLASKGRRASAYQRNCTGPIS